MNNQEPNTCTAAGAYAVSQQPSTATPPRCSCGSFRHPLSSYSDLLPPITYSGPLEQPRLYSVSPCLGALYSLILPASTRIPDLLVMASRQPAGARPGAKFAQFKLVLLGRLSLLEPRLESTFCFFKADFVFSLCRRVRCRKGSIFSLPISLSGANIIAFSRVRWCCDSLR
jgi:hypothetical protein